MLAAAPGWEDARFAHSVGLVLHHSEQGSIGIFLNRRVEFQPEDFWKKLTGTPESNGHYLHLGGTESGPVVALHNCEELAEYTSADGVYFAAQVSTLQELVSNKLAGCDVKIVAGQTEWEPGELERQIVSGCWLPMPVAPSIVFAEEDEMWHSALREIGNQFVCSITGCPSDTVDILAN